MLNSKIKAALLGATALGAVASFAPFQAFAQDNGANALEEVTVTARRREESIVDVPLAISVVTDAKMEQLDLTDTTKLAQFVPSLQFSDYTPGYARNDRGGTRPLIFRGLNLGQGGTIFQGGTMFLDGAAVVGNEVPAGMDIGAVEVLRGPQSVYFGRSTMTGAISYRTKAIPKEFTAEMEAKYAQRNDAMLAASVAGPIFGDMLGGRLTGLVEHTDGNHRNLYAGAGDQRLGERSRKSISATLEFNPLSSVNIKAYSNYFRDVDGPSDTVYIRDQFATCRLPNSTQRTFCGEIPGPEFSYYYHDTNIPKAASDFIFSSKLIEGWMDDKVGLQRSVWNNHIAADWDINDYLKLGIISAYHTNTTLQASHGVGQPFQPGFPYTTYFYTITNKAKDVSHEIRLSSDPERRLNWTIGASSTYAWNRTQALNYFGNANGTVNPSVQAIRIDRTLTTGLFGGVYFDVTDRLTASAEGRYQIDKRYSEQTNAAFEDEFKSTNPRVSLDYDVGGNRKIYASYATGTRAGGFNANIGGFLRQNNPVLTAQIVAAFGAPDPTFDEEKLAVYELGFKGDLLGRGFFDINLYTGTVTNQQVGYSAFIPLLGFTVVATANVGETEFHGVEWVGNYRVNDNWSINTTAAWNFVERTKYITTTASEIAQYGTNNFAGTRLPYSPEYSASAVLSYERPIRDDWNFFANGSWVYRGKMYTDIFNASYVEARHQFDLRVGVDKEKLRLEAFVVNILDNQEYTAGAVAGDFGIGGGTFLKFSGAQALPRQFGVRISASY